MRILGSFTKENADKLKKANEDTQSVVDAIKSQADVLVALKNFGINADYKK